MFDDFPVVIEPKNINACPISITRPLLITVQDHVVSFGKRTFKVDALAWILLCHPREVRNEGLLAISNSGIMLDIRLPCISLDRFGGLTLIEHQIIELHHRLFVALQLLIQDVTPSMLVSLLHEPGFISFHSFYGNIV
jgi:hypothetical protein